MRRGTSDLTAYHKIFGKNEYNLPAIKAVCSIVDAGANIGCSAVFFALKYQNATIIAIEPERRNLEILYLNTGPYGNIKVIEAALASNEDLLRLCISGQPDSHRVERELSDSDSVITRQQHARDAQVAMGISIPTLMQDEKIESIDLLKIDIEGGEVDVLNAKARWIQHVRCVAIEPHCFAKGSIEACEKLKNDFHTHFVNGETLFFTDPVKQFTKSLPATVGSPTSNSEPSVAVCIPTYNQAHYLAECIDSVFAQTRPPDEVWISDDASTDATYETVSMLKRRYPNIHYICQPERLGMSGNPRWVVQQPKTDFIAKLDSDDKYKPRYLETLLASIQAYPSAGYAHCDVEFFNEKSEVFETRRLCRNNTYVDSSTSLYNHLKGFKVTANVILYRRQALEDVNFFSSTLTFCDDWDIGARLADKGWGNVYVPEVLACYRVWTDTHGLRSKRILDRIESTIHVYDKTLSPAFIKKGWPVRLIQSARIDTAAHLATSPLIGFLDEQSQARSQSLLSELGLGRKIVTNSNHLSNRITRYSLQIRSAIKAVIRRRIIEHYQNRLQGSKD